MDLNMAEAVLIFGLTLFGQIVWKYDVYWDTINSNLEMPMFINAVIIGILFYIK